MGAAPMQALPPKKEVALALLQRSTVFIHLDPRKEEARVPPWFKKQPQLVLQIGLNMAVPIRDLEVDDEAISCTLSFNRTPHFCLLPWTAIYALVGEDGRGMVWPDDVPPEVAAQANAKGAQQQTPRKKPHLRAVSEPEVEEAADEAEPERSEPETPRAEEAAIAEGKRTSERPVLSALPEPETDAAPEAAALQATEADSQQDPAETEPSTDEESSEAATAADAAEEKGKRKLPPYLRVVK